ncbi:MAG: dihydroneopterin aldolase [Alphaproteobacteria bacterium]|nr:dihydroneopterin aldolase [Alphaproteobacteria bacterium]
MNAPVADLAVTDPVEQRLLERVSEVRKIFFRNLMIDARMGVHDHEQGRTQPVRINIVLYMHQDTAPNTDSITEVFNYDLVRDGVLELVGARHINLQETMVEEIANFVLGFEQVLAVRVSTEKTDVYPECDGVGFELIRVRPDNWGKET